MNTQTLTRLVDHLTRPSVDDRAVARLTQTAFAPKPRPLAATEWQRPRKGISRATKFVLSLYDPASTPSLTIGSRTWVAWNDPDLKMPAGYQCGWDVVRDPFGASVRYTAWMGDAKYIEGKIQKGRRAGQQGWYRVSGNRKQLMPEGFDPNKRSGKPNTEGAEAIKSLLEAEHVNQDHAIAVLKAIPSLTHRQQRELKAVLEEKFKRKMVGGSGKAQLGKRLEDQTAAILRHLRVSRNRGSRLQAVGKKTPIPEGFSEKAAEIAQSFGAKGSDLKQFIEDNYDGKGDAREWAGAYLFEKSPKEFPDWVRDKQTAQKMQAALKGDKRAKGEVVAAASGMAKQSMDGLKAVAEDLTPQQQGVVAGLVAKEVKKKGGSPEEVKQTEGLIRTMLRVASSPRLATKMAIAPFKMIAETLTGKNIGDEIERQGGTHGHRVVRGWKQFNILKDIGLSTAAAIPKKIVGAFGKIVARISSMGDKPDAEDSKWGKLAAKAVGYIANLATTAVFSYGIYAFLAEKVNMWAEKAENLLNVPAEVVAWPLIAGTVGAAVFRIGKWADERAEKRAKHHAQHKPGEKESILDQIDEELGDDDLDNILAGANMS